MAFHLKKPSMTINIGSGNRFELIVQAGSGIRSANTPTCQIHGFFVFHDRRGTKSHNWISGLLKDNASNEEGAKGRGVLIHIYVGPMGL
jgi:hypothetical protein